MHPLEDGFAIQFEDLSSGVTVEWLKKQIAERELLPMQLLDVYDYQPILPVFLKANNYIESTRLQPPLEDSQTLRGLRLKHHARLFLSFHEPLSKDEDIQTIQVRDCYEGRSYNIFVDRRVGTSTATFKRMIQNQETYVLVTTEISR